MIAVTQSTIARWENGSRLPDAVMITRIARYLDVDVNTLLRAAAESDDSPNVIMVEDRKIILSGSLAVIEEVLPGARIMGFTRPSEAIEYAKINSIALAFLDIDLGKTSGLDLCQRLLDINPQTNVVYITAYEAFALDAWSTGACGFMLKPLTPEGIRAQLKNLKHPFYSGGTV